MFISIMNSLTLQRLQLWCNYSFHVNFYLRYRTNVILRYATLYSLLTIYNYGRHSLHMFNGTDMKKILLHF